MNRSRPIPGWTPSTPDIRGPEIDRVTRLHPIVAIHFWATWNAHDLRMDRIIQVVKPRFEGRVFFASCNVDHAENAVLIRACGVGNIPALGILVSGKPRRSIIGVCEPERLADEIEMRLRDPAPPAWWAFWRRSTG